MESYKVMESFYSIQGEGYHTGKPAFFIRLAGCNIGCSWCDVKESWDEQNSTLRTVASLVNEAQNHQSERVIITGGEPTMYNLTALTNALQKVGIKTHLETSGAYSITGSWDWVCISPKKFKSPLVSELNKADELKVVILNSTDLAWAEQHANYVLQSCKLFLQPEWDKTDSIIARINNYVLEHPKWRISLQTHKYMNVR